MRRKKPTEKKIMAEMAEIAFNPDEKTSDRLRALDMLSSGLEKDAVREEALSKLDTLLSLLDKE